MTVNQPRVSAIITAYNSASFIKDAIESVLIQSRPVDEIIVIDDGSTDETPSIVAAYLADGVHYVYQDNQGAGAARNRGIAESRGDYIAFLDADDIWLPDKIARQLTYLEAHSEIDLVSGYQWWWDYRHDKRWLKRFGQVPVEKRSREILIHNFVGNPSMTLFRRSMLDRTGIFDSTLYWGQDWEFFIRVVSRGRIAFLPEPVIVYRWHADNISHERRWRRLSYLLGISERAISTYRPAYWRPILRARTRSMTEWKRAVYAYKHGFPQRKQFSHAARAFFSYPFEESFEKFKILVRVLVGETLYTRVRSYAELVNLRQHAHR